MKEFDSNNYDPKTIEQYQRWILGAVLGDAIGAAKYIPNIDPRLFPDKKLHIIAEKIIEFHRNKHPINIQTVISGLKAEGALQAAGGALYISKLTSNTCLPSQILYYMSELSKAKKIALYLEQAKKKVNEIMSSVYNEPEKTSEKKKQELLIPIKDLKDEPEDWIIEDDTPADSLIYTYGDSGTFKSFTEIDRSCCIALNLPFHGKATNGGAVVYVNGEGKSGFRKRVRAWEIHNGVEIKDNFFVTSRAVHFRNKASLEEFVSEIDKNKIQPRMIVIDTLSKNFGLNGSTDTSKDAAEFGFVCDRLRDKYRCSIRVVHHVGHSEKHRMRGSYDFIGQADRLYLHRKRKNSTQVVVYNVKNREGAVEKPMAYNLIEVELPNENGKKQTSLVLKVSDTLPSDKTQPEEALHLLKSLIELSRKSGVNEPGIRLSIWQESCYKKLGFNRRRFSDAKIKLQSDKEILIGEGDDPPVMVAKSSTK